MAQDNNLKHRMPPGLSEGDVHWRHDPSATLSDWTIVVSTEDTEENGGTLVVKYRVHRHVIAVGQNSSKYFAALFAKMCWQERDETSIKLPSSAAMAFPLFLDMLYFPVVPEIRQVYPTREHNAKTSVGLKHLADYFDVDWLKNVITQVIKGDMDTLNLAAYLVESRVYSFDDLIDETKAVALRNPYSVMSLSSSYGYMELLPLQEQVEILRKAMTRVCANCKVRLN